MPENNQNNNKDERIEKILDQIVRYTTSDFSVRETISGKGDELDAIIVGLNTLGEEMQASGRALTNFEKRINNIMEILLRYTVMDFSTKIEITQKGDELDAIGVGINTMAEELKAALDAETLHTRSLEERNEEIEKLNESLESTVQQFDTVNKELEAFTYSVSHDLRAPLRAIHGYTKILSEDYSKVLDADGKKMMDSIMRNAKKMGQLIDDLLTFSRTGKKELVTTTIKMTELAQTVLQELKPTFQDIKAKVKILPMPEAIADFNLMSLVFANLISNGIKYSAKKDEPVVEVGSKGENGSVVYYVKDNGSGFDMLYYDKLFGVFQRLHGDEFEGTGVGLALVKRIITRHGGKIWAEAKLNEGACFYFTLNNNLDINQNKRL